MACTLSPTAFDALDLPVDALLFESQNSESNVLCLDGRSLPSNSLLDFGDEDDERLFGILPPTYDDMFTCEAFRSPPSSQNELESFGSPTYDSSSDDGPMFSPIGTTPPRVTCCLSEVTSAPPTTDVGSDSDSDSEGGDTDDSFYHDLFAHGDIRMGGAYFRDVAVGYQPVLASRSDNDQGDITENEGDDERSVHSDDSSVFSPYSPVSAFSSPSLQPEQPLIFSPPPSRASSPESESPSPPVTSTTRVPTPTRQPARPVRATSKRSSPRSRPATKSAKAAPSGRKGGRKPRSSTSVNARASASKSASPAATTSTDVPLPSPPSTSVSSTIPPAFFSAPPVRMAAKRKLFQMDEDDMDIEDEDEGVDNDDDDDYRPGCDTRRPPRQAVPGRSAKRSQAARTSAGAQASVDSSKPYACPIPRCTATFTRTADAVRHSCYCEWNPEKSPGFLCPFCKAEESYVYPRKDSCRRHAIQFHGVEGLPEDEQKKAAPAKKRRKN